MKSLFPTVILIVSSILFSSAMATVVVKPIFVNKGVVVSSCAGAIDTSAGCPLPILGM